MFLLKCSYLCDLHYECRRLNLILEFQGIIFNFVMVNQLILLQFTTINFIFYNVKIYNFLFFFAKCKSVLFKNSSHLICRYHVSSPSFSYQFKFCGTYFGIKTLSCSQVNSLDSAILLIWYFFTNLILFTNNVIVFPFCKIN